MPIEVAAFSKEITPQSGILLAGYGPEVVSTGVHDPLFIKGLALNDGGRKILLMSFDLIGLDRDFIVAIRNACAARAHISPRNIVLTCTHTHSGPHTRRLANLNFNRQRLNEFDRYKKFLIQNSAEAVSNIFTSTRPMEIFHYSTWCHENLNRRYINPDGSCTYLPLNKHLIPMANNITDPELGIIYFVDAVSRKLAASLVNYAAHPLTCQSAGKSSHLISADYPGVLRREVESQLGGNCIFTSGACGDLHPKGFECGFSRTEEMGQILARKVINSYSDAVWNPEKYRLQADRLHLETKFVKLRFRTSGCVEQRLPLYEGKKTSNSEIMILAIGDIALAGVPGELLCAPGLEIKWHSPFRKTYILYNSTAYLSYLPHGNCFTQGGYEPETCHLEPGAAFKLISATIEMLEKMKEE